MRQSSIFQGSIASVLMLMSCMITTAHAQSELEDKVKSAFVYNFAKFIDWPDLGAKDNSDFNICVAGQSTLGNIIHQTLSNKVIKNRTIFVRSIGWTSSELDGCHMLYLNGSDSPNVVRLLQAAHSKPILTIGERDDFAQRGGIIQFLIVSGKVRFTINQTAAQSAGLNISAKLLNVAFEVRQQVSANSYTRADKSNRHVVSS